MKKLSFSVGMMRNSRKLWWAVVLVGVFRSLPNLLVVPNNNFKGRNERHPDGTQSLSYYATVIINLPVQQLYEPCRMAF